MKAPKMTGIALKIFLHVLETPIIGDILMWKMKKESGFDGIWNVDVDEFPGTLNTITLPFNRKQNIGKNIFWNFNLFEAHGYTLQRLKDYHQQELTNIFMFGIIYIVHKNNYSNIKELTSVMSFKNIMKRIIRGKMLSKSMGHEFGLYKILQKK